MRIIGIKIKTPWEISVEELPEPQPGEGDALIRVKSVGICGSDIGAFRGTNPLVSYPRVIGHEVTGEVVSVKDNTKGIQVGDHVIVDPYLYCGDCYPCSIGRTNCCEHLRVLGVHCDGGFAKYLAHPSDMLIKVPIDMAWEVVPLAEPLTIALHGLHRSGLAAGEHVAVSGAGPIGLLAAMAALHYGAIPILIDPLEERLARAKKLGVKHTVQLGKDNLMQKIDDYTSGRLAEVVMEASGAQSAIASALDIVSYAGRVILTGWPKNETPLDTAKITKKELDVRGARTSVREFEEAVELIYTGKVNAAAILTNVIPAGDVPDVVKDIEKNPGNYLKVNALF